MPVVNRRRIQKVCPDCPWFSELEEEPGLLGWLAGGLLLGELLGLLDGDAGGDVEGIEGGCGMLGVGMDAQPTASKLKTAKRITK